MSQTTLFDELQQETTVKPSEPVMCLGQTFVSDEERRKHFTALLREKLKVFRLEAVRAGFKKAWQDRDYATIVAVADKIPNNVLEEDPKLLMWYDQAVTRIGAD